MRLLCIASFKPMNLKTYYIYISNQKQDVSQQQLTCFIMSPLTSVATKSTLFHGDLRPTQTPTNRRETIELTQATVNAWVHHKSYKSLIQWFNHLDIGLPSMSPSQNTGKSDFSYFFLSSRGWSRANPVRTNVHLNPPVASPITIWQLPFATEYIPAVWYSLISSQLS